MISEEVCRKVRNRLYAHLRSLPFRYHVRIKTGDLVQRCTSDLDRIRRFLAGQISKVVYSVATAVRAVDSVFHLPAAGLAGGDLVPLLVIYAYVFFTRVQKAFLASDEAEGDLSTAVQENLSGIRVVKAFNNEREGNPEV